MEGIVANIYEAPKSNAIIAKYRIKQLFMVLPFRVFQLIGFYSLQIRHRAIYTWRLNSWIFIDLVSRFKDNNNSNRPYFLENSFDLSYCKLYSENMVYNTCDVATRLKFG